MVQSDLRGSVISQAFWTKRSKERRKIPSHAIETSIRHAIEKIEIFQLHQMYHYTRNITSDASETDLPHRDLPLRRKFLMDVIVPTNDFDNRMMSIGF